MRRGTSRENGTEGAAFDCVSVPGAACHKGFDDADVDTLNAVFAEAVGVLDACGVPYVVIGGLASAAIGRPRASADIDLLVMPQDARRGLMALAEAGFATDEINPHWLFKAVKHGVLVDLLFKMKGDIYLDAEMLERATTRDVLGSPARVIPSEDLVVVKAIAHDEESTRHWFDALGVVAAGEMDWDYLLRRAAKGPRRVLSLLLYATSVDLVVPARVIRDLHEHVSNSDAP
jgi:predicted nucleotidyltransferase